MTMKLVDGELVAMTPEEQAELAASFPAAVPTVDDFRRAIQARIDETAHNRSYDSGVTCASYVGSTNPAWAAEAGAFVAWRDDIWAHAYTELAKVQSGERAQPTVADLLAELPAITWPA